MRSFMLLILGVLFSAAVNAQVGTIGPTLFTCEGATVTLACTPSGGVWSSADPSIASIDASTGIVTGISAGTVTISYDAGSSGIATASFTVNGAPDPIMGAMAICVGDTFTLTDATTGGTWSSSGGAATVSSTGFVTGILAGTEIVTYTAATGCEDTAIIPVSIRPTAIAGATTICTGACVALTDAVPGGTWISSSTGVATIGASTGILCGLSAGITDITYTGTLCYVTSTITVNPTPSPIGGASSMCVGSTTTLTSGTGGGTWSTSGGIASVGASTGIVTGLTAGIANITYLLPTGCFATYTVTVNPMPTAITSSTGLMTVCLGSALTLSNTVTGGTWSSSNTSVASIDASTGVVTTVFSGTTTITYMLPTGCSVTTVLTVNPVPTAITGTSIVCIGITSTLSSSPGGGTWSSSAAGVATIASATGVVTGVTAGTATMTYTLPAGCYVTRGVTVNTTPTVITGTTTVCLGATSALSSTPTGGLWSSSNPSVASIGTSSGVITGFSVGTTTMTYTISNGCYWTAPVTVITSPASITGPSSVCVLGTITLADATSGGTWFSNNPAIASVDTNTGVVTGVIAGSVMITYTLGGGCLVSTPIVVNPIPAAISGPTQVCVGHSITLSNTVAGGTWSGGGAIATVGATTGVVTGSSAGLVTISYTLPTGCFTTVSVSVDPLPCPTLGTATAVVNPTASIYPNPAFDEMTIKTVAGTYTTFTITNSVGQVLIQQPLQGTETSVNIKPLPSAIYYITLKGSEGISVQRFVKE